MNDYEQIVASEYEYIQQRNIQSIGETIIEKNLKLLRDCYTLIMDRVSNPDPRIYNSKINS